MFDKKKSKKKKIEVKERKQGPEICEELESNRGGPECVCVCSRARACVCERELERKLPRVCADVKVEKVMKRGGHTVIIISL